MYRTTLPLSKMVTTHGGMRSILKKPRSAVEFIRKAVETGIYRDLPQNDPFNPQNQRRNPNFRNNNQDFSKRGRGGGGNRPRVDKYPEEYEILRRNTPLPDPGRLSKKDIQREERYKRLRAKEETEGVKRYVKEYMERYDAKQRRTRPLTQNEREEGGASEEEYYRTILGTQGSSTSNSSAPPKARVLDMNTRMGLKSPVLDHAYNFAVKQYELMHNPNNRNMTEEESIALVEQMLEEDRQLEAREVRSKTQHVSQWRTETDSSNTTTTSTGSHTREERRRTQRSNTSNSTNTSTPTPTPPPPPPSSIPSILTSKPRTIRALSIWGKRLSAVPYHRWTLGATTALDHWIAVDVLGMDESSWEALLDGTTTSGDDETILGMGRDIVVVRGMLFPETTVVVEDDDEEEEGELEGVVVGPSKEYKDATDRSIDELLASLGGFDNETETQGKEGKEEPMVKGDDGEESGDLDSRFSDMVDKLQEWRAKNQETRYDDWSSEDKEEFGTWLTDYIDLVTPTGGPNDPTTSGRKIDLNATRQALLSEPPRTREASDAFWDNVQDETTAEVLLDHLTSSTVETPSETEDGGSTKTNEALSVFLQMPREKQLRHLVDLGTLRPILDEYSLESSRLKFMERYGDILLEGVELEHLVSDPNGSITGRDIRDESLLRGRGVDDKPIGKDERFRIEMIPYGTDEFGTRRSARARALYRAWNMQKGGRARYEEFLYKKGKMPLKEGGDDEE